MVLVKLPKEMRSELKAPLGPVRGNVDESILNGGLITVGDVVTFHFIEEGVYPDVAFVDGKTKRKDADSRVVDAWKKIPSSIEVSNPAGTVTEDLIRALKQAIESDESTRIEVDGEEDLATLPAIVLASIGDTVVYGQPDAGMVYVRITEKEQENAVRLLEEMEVSDPALLRDALGI